MVSEIKYIGSITPYEVPGVGIVNQGDTFKVASDRVEYFTAQEDNFVLVPKEKSK